MSVTYVMYLMYGCTYVVYVCVYVCTYGNVCMCVGMLFVYVCYDYVCMYSMYCVYACLCVWYVLMSGDYVCVYVCIYVCVYVMFVFMYVMYLWYGTYVVV